MPLLEKSLIACVLYSENTKDKIHLFSVNFFTAIFFKKQVKKISTM